MLQKKIGDRESLVLQGPYIDHCYPKLIFTGTKMRHRQNGISSYDCEIGRQRNEGLIAEVFKKRFHCYCSVSPNFKLQNFLEVICPLANVSYYFIMLSIS